MSDNFRPLTPEMVEPGLSDTPENRAWLAEWRRVGAPPGSLRYELRTLEEQLAAERATPLPPDPRDAQQA